MSAIDLLRDLGKHFRMGTMLSKDVVQRRLQSEEGISLHEFSYQILQANDYPSCSAATAARSKWVAMTSGQPRGRHGSHP